MKWKQKALVSILISDKIHFIANIGTRDKKGYFIMIKDSIHQENRTIINICACKNRLPKIMKQKLTGLKGEIDKTSGMQLKQCLQRIL